jgi:hypothetical protein
MTTTTSTASTLWRLEGQCALLHCGPLQAIVDVATPQRGLTQLRYLESPLDGSLLGVDVAAEPNDAYVRGGDLVVAYSETAERPYSVQIYWSVAESPTRNALFLDATVSIQTRRWEAYPRVAVASSLAGAETIRVAETVCLARPVAAHWSYAEVAPVEDFVLKTDLTGDSTTPTSGWLFGDQFMERGVIRRLRVRGAFIPRCDDAASASCIHVALLAETPPLTA